MGWKSFKEHFGIEHFVQISRKGLCIGSPYVHDLAVVDLETGSVVPNRTFADFVKKNYPKLDQASPEQVLQLIRKPDVFEKSVTVYTYKGGDIIEKQCEEPGWPNVTHDGDMMYENLFSTDRNAVVVWAKRNADAEIGYLGEEVRRLEEQLTKMKERLAQSESALQKLNKDFPDVEISTN